MILDGGKCLKHGAVLVAFSFPDSRSKTACRATPASAAGGGYSEQGLAQRSKKSRKSGSPKIFSGTARGVAKQLRALLPLPPKKP